MKTPFRAAITIIAAASALALAACSDSSAGASTAATQQPAPAPAAVAVEPEATTTSTQPEHFYAMSEDGEYGYEQALSEDDVKAGRATSALLMVRYLGESKGVRSIKHVEGDVSTVVSCAAPCKFVKSKVIFSGRVIRTDTVPVTDGSVIQAMMSDAFNDRLSVYGRKAS